MKLSNSSKFIEIATISVCSIVALLTLYADDSYAQYLTKRSYTFESPDPLPRLAANSVSDIIVTGEKLWFGTGGGLSSTEDGGITWVSYDERHGIGKGGVGVVPGDGPSLSSIPGGECVQISPVTGTA